MITIKSIKGMLACAMLAGTSFWGWGAEPSGYYSTCENKGGATLLTALQAKVGPHTAVSYDGLWDLFKTSDVRPNGKLWDMYSTKEWTPGQSKCGNYKNVGDCYNREHSFPKSWFNDATPMYTDAFHLYPTDGKVNGQRSNYPFGECASGTTLPSYNGVDALGKLGKSTFPGYTGTVFEPDDQYKGDFARSYFYMAAAYNDRISTWSSDMLARNKYPAFASWAVDLLLKWHRQDPVSQKEIDRNEAVYAKQKNRNPFIDHPEMVEYIWGEKKTQNWTSGAGTEPELVLPVKGTTVDLGTAAVGVARTVPVVVKGNQLTQAVNLSVAGTGFSVSPSSVTAVSANANEGVAVNVTYKAAAAGIATGTLTVSCGTLSSTVTLTARALDGLPATAPTNVSDESFVAHWTYIGDADSHGCYTISVKDASGEEVDTYPRSVVAADEAFLVVELTPSTTYSYTISSATGIRSNEITVTTADPIPSIQFLYDGDLAMTADPGEPSEAYEIVLDVENIDTDITLSVAAPFQLSSDKGEWGTSLVVAPSEDRFFLRVLSESEGVFRSTLRAVAGTYVNDETELSATVSTSPSFFEDFEAETPGGSGYNTSGATVVGTTGEWYVYGMGIYGDAAHDGDGYLRSAKSGTRYAYTIEPKKNGLGVITFYAAAWANSEGGKLEVQTSTDNGETWHTAGTVEVPGSVKQYAQYTVTANVEGNVQLRFNETEGGRLLIDDINATDYRAGIEGVESDYRSWTAYSRNGELVVELADDANVAIHGVDGLTHFRGTMNAGENTIALPAGLYIVVVDDFSRRVLVK